MGGEMGLVAKLRKGAELFEAVRAMHAGAEGGDAEPHWSSQGEAETAHDLASEAAAAIERLVAENRALTEALTPSGGTKAEYAGEFTIAVERMVNDDEEADDDGDVDPYDHIAVPWTTIKQIMAAISARARQALGDT